MAEEDQIRWDQRYSSRGPASVESICPPSVFTPFADVFPTAGHALDLACGQGRAAVWLASRGLDVWGLDASPVAIEHAGELARAAGVGARCRFDVIDLDDGLPAGPQTAVVVCQRFRDRRLDRAVIGRLASGGLLAITALSEVGAASGPFRVAAGELPAAFAELEVITAGEGEGLSWLLARKPD